MAGKKQGMPSGLPSANGYGGGGGGGRGGLGRRAVKLAHRAAMDGYGGGMPKRAVRPPGPRFNPRMAGPQLPGFSQGAVSTATPMPPSPARPPVTGNASGAVNPIEAAPGIGGRVPAPVSDPRRAQVMRALPRFAPAMGIR